MKTKEPSPLKWLSLPLATLADFVGGALVACVGGISEGGWASKSMPDLVSPTEEIFGSGLFILTVTLPALLTLLAIHARWRLPLRRHLRDTTIFGFLLGCSGILVFEVIMRSGIAWLGDKPNIGLIVITLVIVCVVMVVLVENVYGKMLRGQSSHAAQEEGDNAQLGRPQ